jgi:hypothetical protein
LTEDSLRRTDELIAEITALSSSEQAATWAQRTLPEKNRLQLADADRLEEAFSRRMAELDRINVHDGGYQATQQTEPVPVPAQSLQPADLGAEIEKPSTERVAKPREEVAAELTSQHVDAKSLKPRSDFPQRLPVAPPSLVKITRRRDREHLRFVASQSCLICARKPSDAHHLRFAQVRALGRKVSDEFTVPLCRTHHREVHRATDERAWWSGLGINPIKVARKLWRRGQQSLESNGRSRAVESRARPKLNGSVKPLSAS